MPNIRFPFVDAYDADHRIFHSGNQGFADDRDRRKVDLTPVRSAKDLLFVAENRPPQRPEPLDLLLGARDFENKILRHEAIERIEDHADEGPKQLMCLPKVRNASRFTILAAAKAARSSSPVMNCPTPANPTWRRHEHDAEILGPRS